MKSRVVTQRCEFECAYIMEKDLSKDYILGDEPDEGFELNSHRYRVEASVVSSKDSNIVVEFRKLKQYLQAVLPDKCFLSSASGERLPGELSVISGLKSLGISVIDLYFPLSAENLVTYVAEQLQLLLTRAYDSCVTVVSVKLRENNDSFVEWINK